MKFTFVFMALLCLALSLHAQNTLIAPTQKGMHVYPDSIRIEFPDQHGLLIFELGNFRIFPDQLSKDLVMLQQVLDQVEKGVSSTATARRIDVAVKENGSREIIVSDIVKQETKITATDKEVTQLLPPGWEVHMHIPVRGKIFLYAQNFSDLKEIISFNSDELNTMLLDQAKKLYVGRKRYVARFIMQKGKITFNDIKFQMPQDFLSVNGSTGFGYVSTHFYPELNLTATFKFGNRQNLQKTRLSLIYNNLFFTSVSSEGKFSNKTNSFLSFAWSRRIGTAKDHAWASLGAGYLIQKKGDYFTGKTAKFFFMTQVGNFAVVPELYLTNDFKNFQMGLKFNYTF